MAQVLKLTLILTLLFSVGLFIGGLLKDGWEMGLYYAFFGFGSLVIPFLIFVVLYHWLVSTRFNYSNLWLRFGVRSIFIILISLIGLFVWAILEYLVTTGWPLDFEEIWLDYKSEYMGYMTVVAILAVLVPPGHYLIRPRHLRKPS
jgi:hypothetical protein